MRFDKELPGAVVTAALLAVDVLTDGSSIVFRRWKECVAVRPTDPARRCYGQRRLPQPFTELRQIQASRRHVAVERFDMAILLAGVLQGNVEDHPVHAEVAEGVVLRRRWSLHEEIALAVQKTVLAPPGRY